MNARITREQQVNGQWVQFAEYTQTTDTLENLKRRQGNVDLPHLKISFSKAEKVEVRSINGHWFRTTLKPAS